MEDKQRIIEKYTKKVMKIIYGVDCYVFFRDTFGLRGIFRDKEIPPYSVKDISVWETNKICSITFNEKLYSSEEISPHAWNVMIHECTHYEINNCFKEPIENQEHTEQFMEIYYRNLQQLNTLREQFNLEVGFDAEFKYEPSEDDDGL